MAKKQKACIVMPTYNEAGNIVSMLDSVFAHDKLPDHELHVLIVDDSSPDGTAKLVRKYQRKNKRVHLLVRTEKEGLGAAYIAGMQHAMELLAPEVIIEMDADHSHHPKYLDNMLAEITRGADFVIGSRYVPGGSIPEDWGIHRKIISKSANFCCRMILGLYHVKDCSGGYRAIRSETLEKIDLRTLDATGYAFQINILYNAILAEAKVTEVPIHFADRTAGTSKMRFTDMLEGFPILFNMRLQKSAIKKKHARSVLQTRTARS